MVRRFDFMALFVGLVWFERAKSNEARRIRVKFKTVIKIIFTNGMNFVFARGIVEASWSNTSQDISDREEPLYVCVVLKRKVILWRVLTANKKDQQFELNLEKIHELKMRPLQRGLAYD